MNKPSLDEQVAQAVSEFMQWREQRDQSPLELFISEKYIASDVAAELQKFIKPADSRAAADEPNLSAAQSLDGADSDRSKAACQETATNTEFAANASERERRIFLEALQTPDDQREAWLIERCGDDKQLFKTVQSLLRHDQVDEDPLEEGLRDLILNSPRRPQADSEATCDPSKHRYAIVRFHQCGGLGEVYVAHDRELNRRVALKQVREELVNDRVAQARFLLEAEITGKLEHPGIVPIYGCGVGEDQRLYYAMRFIRGDSLMQAIERRHDSKRRHERGQPDLEFRKLLSQLIAVCQAVDYAHSRGVIHRDLKPDNVILGKHGEAIVVDWGLAKVIDQPAPLEGAVAETAFASAEAVEGGAVETAQGQQLGTPGYMAPEQAAGRIDELGKATDIYSLGAVLYCILTGRPPFQGPVSEVLQRVQSSQFRPPREVDSSIPGGLNAITMKAMARDPQQRYASAAELAADVERWLGDAPVTAWREPINVRSQRWIRKHQLFVGVVVAAILVAFAGASIGYSFVSKKNRELFAVNQLVEDTIRLLTGYVSEVTELAVSDANSPTRATRVGPEQLQILERSKVFLDDLKKRGAVDQLPRQQLARLYYLLGQTASALQGRQSEAMNYFRSAKGLLDELLAAKPENRTALEDELAATLLQTAYLQLKTETPKEALDTIRQAIVFCEGLVATDPSTKRQENLARAHYVHGNGNLRAGDPASAIASLKTALSLQRSVANVQPDDIPTQLTLDGIYAGLANVYAQQHRFAEALVMDRESAELFRGLVADYPGAPDLASRLAASLMNLSLTLTNLQKTAEAEATLREAIPLMERLRSQYPSMIADRRRLGKAYGQLGVILQYDQRDSEALPFLEKAVVEFDELVKKDPTNHRLLADRGRTVFNLANSYLKTGAHEQSVAAYQSALEVRKQLFDLSPEREYELQLANAYFGLGSAEAELGRLQQGLDNIERSIQLLRDMRRPGDPAVHDQLAESVGAAGEIAIRLQQLDQARRYLLEAHQLLEDQSQAASNDVARLHDLAINEVNLGNIDCIQGKPRAGVARHRQALARLAAISEQQPFDGRFAASQAKAYASLADGLAMAGEAEASEEASRKSVELAAKDATLSAEFQSRRALLHARTDRLDLALAAVPQLVETNPDHNALLYNAALIYALAADEAQRQQQPRAEEEHIARALQLLRQMVDNGVLRSEGAQVSFKRDAELEILRQRQEFQDLLDQIPSDTNDSPGKARQAQTPASDSAADRSSDRTVRVTGVAECIGEIAAGKAPFACRASGVEPNDPRWVHDPCHSLALRACEGVVRG